MIIQFTPRIESVSNPKLSQSNRHSLQPASFALYSSQDYGKSLRHLQNSVQVQRFCLPEHLPPDTDPWDGGDAA